MNVNYLLRKMGQKSSRRCYNTAAAGYRKTKSNINQYQNYFKSRNTSLPRSRVSSSSPLNPYLYLHPYPYPFNRRHLSTTTICQRYIRNAGPTSILSTSIQQRFRFHRQELQVMYSSSTQNSQSHKSNRDHAHDRPAEAFSTKASNHNDDNDDDVNANLVKAENEIFIEPMDHRLLFQYLQLKEFTNDEINAAFDKIQEYNHGNYHDDGNVHEGSDSSPELTTIKHSISEQDMKAYLLGRIKEIDDLQETLRCEPKLNDEEDHNHEDQSELEPEYNQYKREQMDKMAQLESKKAMKLLLNSDIPSNVNAARDRYHDHVDKEAFQTRLTALATELDISRSIPISASMLLVGSSVGIIIPIMPYVVSNLGLTAGEFGVVVSSFAFAKLFANLPAAVLVEKHGRKPYLVYSLVIISFGVGGIGLATEFEHLILCRTLTGIGVSLLSTAATLSITDSSTPLNRARTMAPMMSSFAAGTALGPAVGGILADKIGIPQTFYLVGGMYLALTAVNKLFLSETKMIPEKDRVFPWHESHAGRKRRGTRSRREKDEGVLNSIQVAVSQWQPLLANDKVRNVVMMNGFYWVALSGAQMTLLPLILTDIDGLAMSPTNVGEIYMGMSLVQVFGNPTMAKYIDKIGKVPGIVTGCFLLSASMFTLPFCTEIEQLAPTLGIWALGSTMLSTAPTAYISDNVRDDQRAQAIALLRTAGDVGLLVGASSTGAVADMFNMDVAVHSSASLLLLATTWFSARRYLDWQQSKRLQ